MRDSIREISLWDLADMNAVACLAGRPAKGLVSPIDI